MGIFRRFTDVVAANVNDLVDRFEDPERMLRQAIREMEQAVELALRGAAAVIAEETLLAREVAEQRRLVELWQGREAETLACGDEARGGRARERLSEHRQLLAALEDQYALTAETAGRLRRQVAGMRSRLAEARRKLTTLIARRRAAEATEALVAGGAVRLCDAGSATFERLSRRIVRAEAEAEALAELVGDAGAMADAW